VLAGALAGVAAADDCCRPFDRGLGSFGVSPPTNHDRRALWAVLITVALVAGSHPRHGARGQH